MTTIAHLSDLHFGRLDPPVAEALLDDLRIRSPDLIVVSGDFTQRARTREFEEARDYISRFPTRPLMVPGNHDIPAYPLWNRFFRPIHRFRHFLENDPFPVLERRDVKILGINTARPAGWYLDWSRGRVSESQLRMIAERFGERRPDQLRVLVTHHPFIFPPLQTTRHLAGAPKHTLETLAACGVDLILAGHFHRAWSDLVATRHPDVPSIVVAQASTSTSNRRKDRDPNAYNWIEADLPRIAITSVEWTGHRFADSQMKTYREDTDHWVRIEEVVSR
ncbi:MAG: metallophosphoesterase family protein [Verrucomicrobiales bacterium]|nr:metallophosphoesterase family protein [Verrucomicrobiales bacterium]